MKIFCSVIVFFLSVIAATFYYHQYKETGDFKGVIFTSVAAAISAFYNIYEIFFKKKENDKLINITTGDDSTVNNIVGNKNKINQGKR